MTEKEFAFECHKSFLFFVEKALLATPSSDQKEFIQAVQDAIDGVGLPDISGRSGHGTGKTSTLAWLILWGGLCHVDVKMPTTAPVAAQLINQLIPEVGKWRDQMYPKFRSHVEVQTQDVKFSNGNKCFARTADKNNTEALAGVHATLVIYIVDEASGVPQQVFDVIEGALTGNYIFVMFSNPTRTSGTFYDSHNSKKEFYKTLHFDSSRSSNVDKKYVEKMARKYGEDSDVYRVRVKGNFPSADSDALIPIGDIEAAINNSEVDSSGPMVWGVDVARYGDDSSVLCKRKGRKVAPLEQRRQLSTMQVASWIAGEYKQAKEKPKTIFVDVIGVGAGVYDRLEQLGLPVMPANVSEKSDSDDIFNKRSEIYSTLRDEFKLGLSIPDDEDLVGEISAIKYGFSPTGKLQVEKKEELKKRLGRSPDKGDALALTYFSDVFDDALEEEFFGGDDEYESPYIV